MSLQQGAEEAVQQNSAAGIGMRGGFLARAGGGNSFRKREYFSRFTTEYSCAQLAEASDFWVVLGRKGKG